MVKGTTPACDLHTFLYFLLLCKSTRTTLLQRGRSKHFPIRMISKMGWPLVQMMAWYNSFFAKDHREGHHFCRWDGSVKCSSSNDLNRYKIHWNLSKSGEKPLLRHWTQLLALVPKRISPIISSVRSSYSHPDLLLTHPPTFSDLECQPLYNKWTFTF